MTARMLAKHNVMDEVLSTPFVAQQPTLPLRIAKIYYNVLGEQETRRLSALPCHSMRRGHNNTFGINDPRLGVCHRGKLCATCGLPQAECVGHPGHVELAAPVFHLGFFTTVLRITRTICKSCSHVLLTEEEKVYYRRKLNALKSLDPLSRIAMAKGIQEDAYKTRSCPNCGGINGTVRRVRPLRIVHEKYSVVLREREAANNEDTLDLFISTLQAAADRNPEVEHGKRYAQDVLDPFRVRELFRAIPTEDVCLLGLDAGVTPEDLMMSTLMIPPVCTRPSGPAQIGSGEREDELSIHYSEILRANEELKNTQHDPAAYQEAWDLLQTNTARLLDGALPGFPLRLKQQEMKGFAQRMKGKHGRFRGNLSGKRVDFSGRSVISPDPNLAIDEIAIPLRVARILTYPQRVYPHNLEQMRQMVRNGPDRHPGAVTVTFTREGTCKGLLFQRERDANAEKLSVGDVVERHLINGDLVLFNRQPSLHRISMMCHRARVLPYRTLRFNECCCSPYNADFDGDEMNIHLVQSEEARAEALTLMLTSQNIITAKNGEPIIACTQDFLTAAYLLTSRDMFFDRSAFTQCVSHWLGRDRFEVPYPALLKPSELWTGKQLFDVLIKPLHSMTSTLDLEATAKFYTGKGRHDCRDEGFVSFDNGRMVSGRLDKKLLGGGAKDGLFARLYATTGGPYAAKCMSRIAQFTSRYLMNYGFSLGLGDVAATEDLKKSTKKVLAAAFQECADFIAMADSGKLEPLPGMTVAKTLEAKLNGILSQVRDACGTAAINDLTPMNAPLVMTQSGSKGSALNIAQMVAVVGQQTVGGKRVQNAFIDRSLPHYQRFAEHPEARGFVSHSFYQSLKPTEFFFHTMAGREGLVDTAVKTAETGYIYRRLMKAMEDLSIKYDGTVRNSKGDIIQLHFGEDGLDPQLMEGGSGMPVNLLSTWLSIISKVVKGESKKPSLLPSEVLAHVRTATEGWHRSISHKFKQDVIAFWEKKAKDQMGVRDRLALSNESSCTVDPAKVTAHSVYLDDPYLLEQWATETLPLTREVVDTFMRECERKYKHKICEPGTPCGAIAAQSVGEPSTQMTLRTFHFAGVASMSITQGVPRLVEIINANKVISTPIIRTPLKCNDNILAAVHVKAKMEKVLLKEIATEMVEVVSPFSTYLRIKLNRRLISDLQLSINAATVRDSILAVARRPMSPLRKLTDKHVSYLSPDSLDVRPFEIEGVGPMFCLKFLLSFLPEVAVGGVGSVNRAIISKKKATDGTGRELCEIIAEGADMLAVMNLEEVEGHKVSCNHVASVEKALGIEAARATIIAEIQGIMKAYSLSIDIRHVTLLADVMTHRGVVLGITRYGIQKMNSGVLTMASFERTTEHLYNAAVYQRSDQKLSVSESIIVGSPVPLGSNSFELHYAHDAAHQQRQEAALMAKAAAAEALYGTQLLGQTGRKSLIPLSGEFSLF